MPPQNRSGFPLSQDDSPRAIAQSKSSCAGAAGQSDAPKLKGRESAIQTLSPTDMIPKQCQALMRPRKSGLSTSKPGNAGARLAARHRSLEVPEYGLLREIQAWNRRIKTSSVTSKPSGPDAVLPPRHPSWDPPERLFLRHIQAWICKSHSSFVTSKPGRAGATFPPRPPSLDGPEQQFLHDIQASKSRRKTSCVKSNLSNAATKDAARDQA